MKFNDLFSVMRENRKLIFKAGRIKIKIQNPFIFYYSAVSHIPNFFKLTLKNVRFPHPYGVVIGKNVEIGHNCRIYQRVTIGAKFPERDNSKEPKIGDNVIINANAILLGDITVGDNAIIAAGAVVTKDVPAGAIAMGNPAKIHLQ